MKKTQAQQHGDDGEILEYEKAIFNVFLPKSAVVLPREKSAPKEKSLTKWERFRLEKGMPARKKRGRMVFDPITKDWVPRHGAGSIKKIADKHNWAMEEKPKHAASGMDPFTFLKDEKKQAREKQGLAKVKNDINAANNAASSTVKKGENIRVLAATQPHESGASGLKAREDGDRQQIRKREHKTLTKSL